MAADAIALGCGTRPPRRRSPPARRPSWPLSTSRPAARSRSSGCAREVASGRVDLLAADHEPGWRRLRAIPGNRRLDDPDARLLGSGSRRSAARRGPRLHQARRPAADGRAVRAGDRGAGRGVLRPIRTLERAGGRLRAAQRREPGGAPDRRLRGSGLPLTSGTKCCYSATQAQRPRVVTGSAPLRCPA